MICAIRHIGLVVSDIEEAVKFWCDIMGFHLKSKMEEEGPYVDAMIGLPGVRVTTVKLADPNENLLELLHFHSHPDKSCWAGTPYSTGLTHIALTVSNIQDVRDRLKSAGIFFPREPQMSPDANVKVIYATGPEGILLELVEVLNE